MATPSGPTPPGSSNPDYFPEIRQSFPIGQRLPRHQRAARSQVHLSQPAPTLQYDEENVRWSSFKTLFTVCGTILT